MSGTKLLKIGHFVLLNLPHFKRLVKKFVEREWVLFSYSLILILLIENKLAVSDLHG